MGCCVALFEKCADGHTESKRWAPENFCRQGFFIFGSSAGLVFWIFALPEYTKAIVLML